jgi:molybdate-binding protein
MGCDPSLGILCAHVARQRQDARLIWLSASSRASLAAVKVGEAHLAGSHLHSQGNNEYNVADAKQTLVHTGGLVIAFATWEQGFVVAKGNPKNLRSVADLARPDVRLINRDEGSGCREFLDALLSEAGVAPESLQGYHRTVKGHLAVARSVGSGGADAGVALRAVAHALGLDFVPLAEVRFDFVIPHDLLEHPAVSATLDVLQSRALREELESLPGYDLTHMGEVVAEIAATN